MRTFSFVLVLVLGGHGMAGATTIAGLYSAEVPVASRSESDRNAAAQVALRLVLVKLSGERDAGRSSLQQDLVSKAPELIQQYQYREPSAVGQNPAPLHVRMTFDRSAIQEALRHSVLSRWGRERPLMLVWLLQKTQQGTEFVYSDTDPGELLTLVKAAAERRGIPIVFPMVDAADLGASEPRRFEAMDAEILAAAAARYRAQSILVGEFREEVLGFWETRWRMVLEDNVFTWFDEGELADDVVDAGIDAAADRLAARFAQRGLEQQETGMRLVVQGISTLAQYTQVKTYLDSLDVIKRLAVHVVEDGQVNFQLFAHGGRAAIVESIALGTLLEPIPGHFVDYYQLVRP